MPLHHLLSIAQGSQVYTVIPSQQEREKACQAYGFVGRHWSLAAVEDRRNGFGSQWRSAAHSLLVSNPLGSSLHAFTASTKASKMRREKASSRKVRSGCHCRPITKAPDRPSAASTTPSSGQVAASTS